MPAVKTRSVYVVDSEDLGGKVSYLVDRGGGNGFIGCFNCFNAHSCNAIRCPNRPPPGSGNGSGPSRPPRPTHQETLDRETNINVRMNVDMDFDTRFRLMATRGSRRGDNNFYMIFSPTKQLPSNAIDVEFTVTAEGASRAITIGHGNPIYGTSIRVVIPYDVMRGIYAAHPRQNIVKFTISYKMTFQDQSRSEREDGD